MPATDLNQRTGRVAEQTVIVQHSPGPHRLQWSKNAMGQLG